MTRTFTTFIAPAVFATAVLAGNAAEAAYTPEAERILDVVAQTGTTITHKVCTGEDKGSYGFYQLHTDDDSKVTKDELTVCTDQAKGRAYHQARGHPRRSSLQGVRGERQRSH